MTADLNLTPSNDGNMIRINIPPLTSETRAQFAKQASALAEDGKVGPPASRCPSAVLHASLPCTLSYALSYASIMRLYHASLSCASVRKAMPCLAQVWVEAEAKGGGGKEGGWLACIHATVGMLVARHACATHARRCLCVRVSK